MFSLQRYNVIYDYIMTSDEGIYYLTLQLMMLTIVIIVYLLVYIILSKNSIKVYLLLVLLHVYVLHSEFRVLTKSVKCNEVVL